MQVEDLLTRIAVTLERIETHILEAKPRKRERGVNTEPCQLMDIWNKFKHEKFPKVLDVSRGSTRDRNAKARWKEKGSDEYWTQVILRLNRSSFAQGKNEKGWVADFDFFIRPDTHNKVLEGKYDDKSQETYQKFLGFVDVNGVKEPVYQTVRK